MNDLAELLASVVDLDVREPFGAYLFASDDPGAEIARDLEAAVLFQAFRNDRDELAREYGPYEDQSLFFCVIDHRRRAPAGVMRLVLPGPGGRGLKSLNDLESHFGEGADALFSRSHIALEDLALWDIATLVVSPEYRDAAAIGLVHLGLYQSVVRAGIEGHIDGFVAILDRLVYRMARMRFHQPFHALCDATAYLGSPASFPVYCQLREWGTRLSIGDRAIYDVIFRSVGIAPAMRPVEIEKASLAARALLAACAVEERTPPTLWPATSSASSRSPLSRDRSVDEARAAR